MLALVAAIHSTLTAAPSRHWLAGWSRFSGIAGGQGRFINITVQLVSWDYFYQSKVLYLDIMAKYTQ